MKKALVIRTGALGDMLMVTPVFPALKKLGYHVICNTGKRGLTVLKGNPHIDEYIEYPHEDVKNPHIDNYWENLIKEVNADWVKNFSESIEVNVAMHPRSPAYIYPKEDRRKIADRNYYEATEAWGNLKFDSYLPQVFLTEDEIAKAREYLNPDKYNIVWCLSGSGKNKVYPWTDYVMGEFLKNRKDVQFITVGGDTCQLLETFDDPDVINLSGDIDFRTTMALTKICDLVVSPDTGTLHAAGAWDTPKIGILGHTNITNITKHFLNDFSLNSDETLAECSPCFRLIYDHKIQCPIDLTTGAAFCMAYGQPAQRLYDQIERVLNNVCSNRKQPSKSSSI